MESYLGNGTAFEGDKIQEIGEVLVKHGYSYHDHYKELLMSGITGGPLKIYVFCGLLFYQRLKHMVADKMYARSRRPKASLIRQATEGRSKEGGLRLGEIERDCLIGYEAPALIFDRLLLSRDAYKIDVCENCVFFEYDGKCSYCKEEEKVSQINIPYAFKLLIQKLITMGIRIKIILTRE